MFQKLDYVMVMVSKMETSVKFYRDTLGLKLQFESPGWSQFETGSTTLALHLAAAPAAKAPEKPAAGTLQLGFNVADIERATLTLKERGIQFTREPTLQPKEGIKLAVFLDPDGMPISIAQSLRK